MCMVSSGERGLLMAVHANWSPETTQSVCFKEAPIALATHSRINNLAMAGRGLGAKSWRRSFEVKATGCALSVHVYVGACACGGQRAPSDAIL